MDIIWWLIERVGTFIRRAYWRAVQERFRRRYSVHRDFRFNGHDILLYGDGRISLGAGSYIGEHSTIQSGPGRSVTVGQRCKISHNVRIYTESASADSDFVRSDGSPVGGDVSIGSGVWIGANVYIAPGVSIGDDSVVGANSVVNRSIPDGEIWGGVPAKLIRSKRR